MTEKVVPFFYALQGESLAQSHAKSVVFNPFFKDIVNDNAHF